MSRNRRFLISEVEKIAQLFYFHKPQTPKVTASALRYFSYIYILYQMYVTWSCVTFYHYQIDFQKEMTTVLVLPESILNMKVDSRSAQFHFELNLSKFSGFLRQKTRVKRKRLGQIILTNKKNPEYFLKYSRKKTKISKPFAPFQTIQNLTFSSLTNHGGRHFFKPLLPQLFQCCYRPVKRVRKKI